MVDLASEADILAFTGNTEVNVFIWSYLILPNICDVDTLSVFNQLLLGKLDENPDLIDDAFVGKLGRPLREARLGRHYYTKFYLSNKLDYRHVLVCGLTSTSASQYAK